MDIDRFQKYTRIFLLYVNEPWRNGCMTELSNNNTKTNIKENKFQIYVAITVIYTASAIDTANACYANYWTVSYIPTGS